jgi:hypothetical protein
LKAEIEQDNILVNKNISFNGTSIKELIVSGKKHRVPTTKHINESMLMISWIH